MSSRRRPNRWIALVALCGLLFQQVAMATYRCPIEPADVSHHLVQAAAAAAPCHDAATTDIADPVRCEQHCHPTVASTDHAPPLTVPAALFTNAWSLPAVQRQLRVGQLPTQTAIDPRPGAPPLSVQYCSFQI